MTRETTPWEQTRTTAAYPRTAMVLDTTAEAEHHLVVSEEPIAHKTADSEDTLAAHKDDSKKHEEE